MLFSKALNCYVSRLYSKVNLFGFCHPKICHSIIALFCAVEFVVAGTPCGLIKFHVIPWWSLKILERKKIDVSKIYSSF